MVHVLLIALLAITGTIIARGRPANLLADATTAAARQRRHRLFIANQVLLFAYPTLLTLFVLDRWDAVPDVPYEFWALMLELGATLPPLGANWVLIALFLGGPVVGSAIGLGILAWRGPAHDPSRLIGAGSTLQARGWREVPLALGLSLAAGVCEELFFRLALPLLLMLAFGNVAIALVLPMILFGLVHRYQGWKGVLATTIVGAVLAAMYVLSGSLLVAIVVHAMIDIHALVLVPAVRRWRRAAD